MIKVRLLHKHTWMKAIKVLLKTIVNWKFWLHIPLNDFKLILFFCCCNNGNESSSRVVWVFEYSLLECKLIGMGFWVSMKGICGRPLRWLSCDQMRSVKLATRYTCTRLDSVLKSAYTMECHTICAYHSPIVMIGNGSAPKLTISVSHVHHPSIRTQQQTFNSVLLGVVQENCKMHMTTELKVLLCDDDTV